MLNSSEKSDSITIECHLESVNASISPPGSKSITNRALVCAALATGKSVLSGALDSDDTRVMIESLRKIGVKIDSALDQQRITVYGSGGKFVNADSELFIGNSGTTVRFLTAMLGFSGGRFVLNGVPRMYQRPIGALVDALQALGSKTSALSPGDCPPVEIDSPPVDGGQVSVSGNISSQYLSGLLMAAPQSPQDIELSVDGELVSKPYVEMTIEVMRAFGVHVESDDQLTNFRIGADQRYQAAAYAIEPDASAASYFWAAAAICGGTATVKGLSRSALQGDVGFVDCLSQMGCNVQWGSDFISVTGPAKHGIDVDMSNVSDTVQTLTSVALFVDGPTSIRNIAHNRVKETDRIGNLAIELRKFGVQIDERHDGLTVHPGPLMPAVIETYDDHRMAMALALVGLKQGGVVIKNPGCVSKTYPNYFVDMKTFLS